MADTVSHTISMARSASASAYFASSCASGHAAPMRYGAPSRLSLIHIYPAKLMALYEQGYAEALRVWGALERYLAG